MEEVMEEAKAPAERRRLGDVAGGTSVPVSRRGRPSTRHLDEGASAAPQLVHVARAAASA